MVEVALGVQVDDSLFLPFRIYKTTCYVSRQQLSWDSSGLRYLLQRITELIKLRETLLKIKESRCTHRVVLQFLLKLHLTTHKPDPGNFENPPVVFPM